MSKDNLKRIGYWHSFEQPDLPDPKEFIDNNYDSQLKEKIIKFLMGGKPKAHWKGFSMCRICKKILGTQCWEREGYMYPELLWHYVEKHNVRLPREFEEYVMSRNDF